MKNPFESELERLARTLTDQFGVQVVCQGDQAWTDGSKIVVPSVPEPMEQALERMMLGYLDHEMAHVAFSEFGVVEKFMKKHPGCEGLLNVVEDALIERRAMDRWPGVRRNLDILFLQIRGRVAQLITQRKPFDRFCTAVYLKLSHHNDMIGLEQEVTGYEDLLNRFPQLTKTQHAMELAEEILERWMTMHPPQEKPQSQPDASQANSDSSQSEMSQGGGSSQPQAGKPNGSGSQSRAPSAGSDGNESPQEDDSSVGKDDPADAARTSDPSSGNVNQPHEDSRKPNSGNSDGQVDAQTPGEPSLAAASMDSTSASVAGAVGGGFSGNTLISDAVAEAIAEQVAGFDTSRVYRPYTRQHDRIELVKAAKEAEVRVLMETGRDAVRRLRRGLTNALRSAEKRWWRQDQLRGELSPRTLHRLCMDQPRLNVFRTRSMVQGKSTAVSVVLDASGSMSRRKMDVAHGAMRVLLEALHDLKIATEALTFTTGNTVDIHQLMQQTGLDAHQLRERYGRIANLNIGMIKQFGEPVKAALSRLPNVRGSGLTPLGEAMQIAASRIIARPETRRIMLVLTDGKAGCEGGVDAATTHAQHIAGTINRTGIELIGVGILDDNLCGVVEDTIVIQKLEDLPAQLCKLLSRTLKKGVCHVG